MTKTWLRIISVLEIIGGVFGLITTIWWFSISPINIYSLLLLPIPIAIYILSFLAGYWLWKGTPLGRTASIIIQAVQLPKIYSSLLIFMFSFGFDVWIQFIILNNGLSNFGFQFMFLSSSQIFFNVKDAPTGIGISLTALIFLIMLVKHRQETTVAENELVGENEVPPPPAFDDTNDKDSI